MNERLAYERAVHKQRMRTEIAQVKREANFYINNAEKNQTVKRIKERKQKRGETVDDDDSKEIEVTQRLTEDEIKSKRKRKIDEMSRKKVKKPKIADGDVNKKSLAASTSFINKLFLRASAGDDDD